MCVLLRNTFLSLVLFTLFFIVININNQAFAKDNFISDYLFKRQIEKFGEKQTNKLPNSYSKEDAIKNGDITFFSKRTG